MEKFDWLQAFAMEKQEQPEPGVSADAAPEDVQERAEAFRALIQGPYKKDYDRQVQTIVRERLKNCARSEQVLKSLSPALQKTFGVDAAQLTPEQAERLAACSPEGRVPATPEQREEAPAEAAAPAAALQTAERARGISPRAKNAAERLRLDPAMAAPTGPNGRVIERDIAALAAESRTGSGLGGRLLPCDMETAKRQVEELTPAAPAEEYEDVKLTNIRKVIAKSMHQSLSEMAQLTHTVSFDATCIMNYRKQLKLAAEKLDVPNITLNDIMLYAVSRVLPRHPDLNAHYLGDSIRRFRHVNLGLAVDTPRGLMVPTLFNADEKSLREISSEAKALIAACQEGSINPDLLQGGSFTVSNLGSLGIEHFTPVINPPQTGILGVCGITERVRTGKDGGISVYPAMGLSLTYDHRALDGAPASRFLAELKTALESFTALLIG
mgnify:CR=1 FL=1